MKIKSLILGQLSQCFLTNEPQIGYGSAVMLPPPLALGNARGGPVVAGAPELGTFCLLQKSLLTPMHITSIITFLCVL